MKGIVNTIEAAVGTVILIVLVTAAFGSQLTADSSSSYENVQRQLERMHATGELEEIVSEKNVSKLESRVDILPQQANFSIIYENVTHNESSENSFTQDFSYSAGQTSPYLFLWTEGSDVTVDLNSQQIYDRNAKFQLVNISSETVTGSNSLEFENPSGQRVGYSVTRRSRAGSDTVNEEDVNIIRKVVVPENQDDLAEVVIYLW